MEHYHIFDSPLGSCGIAWSEHGVTRFQLPEGDKRALAARMRAGARAECRGELPRPVTDSVAKLKRYFSGEEIDFSDLTLDLAQCNSFYQAIYDAARSIAWGETTTYGGLARKAGSPRAARAAGTALSKNPIAIIIPCHRILAAGVKIGGFSAHGGVALKERLLELEGVRAGAESMRRLSLFPIDEVSLPKSAH
jgi:methylated-DNA-[protein]-cysteine S-methyltransferase